MPKVVICRGLPASGKTTWAKKQVAKGWTRINKDDIREMIHGVGEDRGYREKLENMVLSIQDTIMVKALREGQNVVIDNTNLHPKHLNRISEVVEAQEQIDRDYFENKKIKYKWEVKDFDVPLHEAIKRDIHRDKSVGEKVIRDMYNQWIRPKKYFEQDQDLPQAIIVDVDGTLAQIGSRSPYDTAQAEWDEPNQKVFDAVFKYQKDGHKVIIVTGRSEEHAELTAKWLQKHGLQDFDIWMRKKKDDREDSVVKEEIFKSHISKKYLVEAVFEDRERVVDMWRDLGLQVFQVAEGKF